MKKLIFVILLSLSACAHHHNNEMSVNDEGDPIVAEQNGPPFWQRLLHGLGRGMQSSGSGLSNAQRNQTSCTGQVVGNVVFANCR